MSCECISLVLFVARNLKVYTLICMNARMHTGGGGCHRNKNIENPLGPVKLKNAEKKENYTKGGSQKFSI